jgi:hypothetical protein
MSNREDRRGAQRAAAHPEPAPVEPPVPLEAKPTEPAAEEPAAAVAPVVEPAPVAPEPIYRVAPRMGITSQRGILGNCEQVYPKDFANGQATIDHLVSVGNLTKS